MNTDPKPQHDNEQAIDQTLAALRHTIPPPGMETRIAARIAQQVAAPVPVPSRVGSLIPSAAWWRGAMTGAMAALLIVGLYLATTHLTSARHGYPQDAVAGRAGTHDSSSHVPAVKIAQLAESSLPCPHEIHLPSGTRTSERTAVQLVAQVPLIETTAPSRPAPELPLTPQERQLARMVRTADPRQLAALGFEEEARLEAERASDLPKVLAQPAPISDDGSASSSASAPIQAPEPAATTQPADPPAAPISTDSTPTQEEQK